MEVPSGGGAGEGQQQDQQEGGNEGTNTTTSTLSASVGQGGKNVAADVLLVKKLLNKVISAGLTETDVNVGPKTIAAIKKFQQEKAGIAAPNGLIEAGSQSWKVLNGESAGTTQPQNGGGEQPQNNTGTTTVEPILAPNSAIKQSVGAGGKNDEADVLLVKKLLNKFGYKLTEDGKADAALTTAIKDFQTKYRGATSPDGKIDPGGNTWSSLIGIGRIQGQLLAMSKQYGVEPAVILAIQQIESGGNGFLADGRSKILFEGHVFWSQLQKAGKNPQTYVKGNEDILYPSWDSTKYQGGAKEYDRLEKAKKIDEIAALKSASWGEFQIMGFNHSTVGYPDVVSFVEAMKVPNGASLKALLEFCKNGNLLRHVNSATKDWAAFAKGYNGPGYAKNQYDVKLAAAYERYKKLA
jgi:peptidoglycan hydrolase-like protein with peptidoglycan-binding domain